MIKKLNKILKSKIFIFILGGMLCSTITAYAVTYFPSNQVTYDNSTSELNSTDVQGAIDELYNVCINSSMTGVGDYILENTNIVTSGDGLYKDEYEEGRYIYKGANPNNYITYNGEKGVWRIIAIEKNGTIKLKRKKSIGRQIWNSTNNDWKAPASLNTYLNETYLKTLNSTAQAKILNSYFSIGSVIVDNDNMQTQITDEQNNKWYGGIGLVTASEYIRANSNKNQCGTISLLNDNYLTCQKTNWMYNDIVKNDDNSYDDDNEFWTITPVKGETTQVYQIEPLSGIIYETYAQNANSVDGRSNVYPVVYLTSEIEISGGNGSESSPYQIK